MRAEVLGLKSKGLTKCINRIFGAANAAQVVAKIVVELGCPRGENNCALECVDGTANIPAIAALKGILAQGDWIANA